MQTICGWLLLVGSVGLVPEGEEFNPIRGELPGERRHLFSKLGIDRGDLVEAMFNGVETGFFRHRLGERSCALREMENGATGGRFNLS